MSVLSIAGAYHLDMVLPHQLSASLSEFFGHRLGPNPLMLIALVLFVCGAVVAAALPLRETTLLLYNPSTRAEVRSPTSPLAAAARSTRVPLTGRRLMRRSRVGRRCASTATTATRASRPTSQVESTDG